MTRHDKRYRYHTVKPSPAQRRCVTAMQVASHPGRWPSFGPNPGQAGARARRLPRSLLPGPPCYRMCCPATSSCLAPRSVAQATGAPLAVGLIGLTAAAMLAVSWAQPRVSAAEAQHAEVAGA